MKYGILDVGNKPLGGEGLRLSGFRRKPGKVREEKDDCGAVRRKIDMANLRQTNTNNTLDGAIDVENRGRKSYSTRAKMDSKTSDKDDYDEEDSWMASEGTLSEEDGP